MLKYPSNVMRITLGTFADFSHTAANKQQYAIDEGFEDTGATGRFTAPCDVKVTYIVDSWNCYYFQSLEKITFADGSKDYLTLKLGHQNYKKFKVGDIIKKGSFLYQEGTAGEATGNHVHLETIKGTVKQSKYYGNISPDQVFYIDDTIKVIDMKNLKFKTMEAMPVGWTKYKFVYSKKKRKARKHNGKTYNMCDQVINNLNYYPDIKYVGTGKKENGKKARFFKAGDLLDNVRYVGERNGYKVHAALNDAGTSEVYYAYRTN